VAADDGAGIQDTVAAHFHVVTQHGTEFFQPGFHFFLAVFYNDQGLIGFYIGGDGTGTHVGLIAQNAVAHIIEVGNLYIVKQNHIFQFHRVAYYTVFAHKSAAADIGTVPDFRIGSNDTGCAQICAGSHGSRFVYPDSGLDFFVFISQSRTELQNQILNALQSLPGIVKSGEIVSGEGTVQIIKLQSC